ncbi:MAG TPA: LysR family transcriptional regulator [Solirubrobacteraceae bacterium]|nr:LysR family transcriptional regulator [Solirubrobacteraceae bacterium]
MAVTLSLLRTFVTVVRTGSVTRASQELVVTQSSVSGALAALSKEMGERLVERDGRGLRPTAAGAAFLPHAERILATLEDGTAAVREAADPSHRRLRLAATTTAGEFLVPPVWNAFHQRHPEVDLTLEVGNRASLIHALDRHQADVGIGGRPLDPRLRGLRFLENEFVLITAPDDPRVRRGPVTVEELLAGTWLIREAGSGTAEVTSEFFASRGLTRPKTLTIGSNGAIKRCVAMGLGVALQPRLAVERELDDGSLARLGVVGSTPTRGWYALSATDAPRRSAAESFLAFIRRGDAARALEPPAALAPPVVAGAGT